MDIKSFPNFPRKLWKQSSRRKKKQAKVAFFLISLNGKLIPSWWESLENIEVRRVTEVTWENFNYQIPCGGAIYEGGWQTVSIVECGHLYIDLNLRIWATTFTLFGFNFLFKYCGRVILKVNIIWPCMIWLVNDQIIKNSNIRKWLFKCKQPNGRYSRVQLFESKGNQPRTVAG